MAQATQEGINFETFVLSLGTATFVALGEIDHPVSKKKEKDLNAAKYNIEILNVLQSKTKGNLSEREEKLLTEVLYEARMKFVSNQESKS